MGSNRG